MSEQCFEFEGQTYRVRDRWVCVLMEQRGRQPYWKSMHLRGVRKQAVLARAAKLAAQPPPRRYSGPGRNFTCPETETACMRGACVVDRYCDLASEGVRRRKEARAAHLRSLPIEQITSEMLFEDDE